MPFAIIDNTRLFYRLEGNRERPVLVLAHSLGLDHSLWDLQVTDLLAHFRILRFDTRGHGASDVPAGDYSIERLGRDVLGLADSLGIQKFAYCGISLGGFVGQWLAIHEPSRLTHLVLSNTSPCVGPPSNWDARKQTVLASGMTALGDMFLDRSFSPPTLAHPTPRVESLQRVFLGTNPQGYAGCCGAIRDMDHRTSLGKIKLSTLVIVGDNDIGTPWTGHGEILAREIAGAKVVRLPAAHLSNVERPRSFTSALFDFLAPDRPIGEQMRRSVLGDAYVDAAKEKATGFTREFQEFITSYAWGTIWTRPGLEPRTRRMLVLATTAALGRWEEFRLHLRAGLAHELEPCDIKELLLQAAIYAGVPTANTGFQIAQDDIVE